MFGSKVPALRSALFAAALPFAFAAPAFAQSAHTYVSNTGTDAGLCDSAAAACRTFNYAIAQTAPGGEMKAINAGDFGAFKVDKAITVVGAEGATVHQTGFGDGVSIAAPTNANVTLIGLEIVGNGKAPAPGSNGVNVLSAGQVTIKNCIVRDWAMRGITFVGATRFLVEDTTILNVPLSGVSVRSTPAVSIGAVNRVTVEGAGEAGVYVDYQNRVSVSDTVVVHSAMGYAAGGSGRMAISHSSARENGTGIVRFGGASLIESAGNNFFRDNATNVSGMITPVGMQ